MNRLKRVLPNTTRGFIPIAFATSTVLLVLFGTTRFIPFGFLAVVAFVTGLYLTVHVVWERFQRWLGWTQHEQ